MNHLDLNSLRLEHGGHRYAAAGMCLMEAVAYFAHEPHTDHPECASPVLTAFGIAWNDALDDTTRQRLRSYIPRLVGTRADDATEERRSWMALDWLVRVHAPAWLRLAGLTDHADRLESADELVDTRTLDAVKGGLYAACSGAAAAWVAAWDAARVAAWDAARVAAWAAARDAAWVALQPTVEQLQESAFALFDRMIDARVEVAA